MQPACRTFVALVCALVVWSASPVRAAAPDPFASAQGVFVTSVTQGAGASITIQQGERLMVYSLAPSAVTRERSDDGSWAQVALSQLVAGEPVTVQLDPAGYVTAVDAEYATVITRLIAQKSGYVITASGEAYRLVGAAAAVQPSWKLGTFLKMRVDESTSTAFDISASSQPFSGGPLAQPIQVTIIVTVPSNTPTRDIVYMATDAANWVPNGVRMSPLTGNRWTATLTLGKGSSLKYKYTRGSWQTAETNQSGMEIPNRSLSITKTNDTQQVQDLVVRWSDLQ
jgi:hypothetical protein